MYIGIDALFACNHWGGLSIYSKQIIRHLIEIDSENQYLLFIEKGSEASIQEGDNLRIQELNRRPKAESFYDTRVVWDQDILPKAVAESEIDLFFGPVFMAPLRRSCPAVITVHDLIFITHPKVYPVQTLGYYGVWGRLCAESAEGLITISHDTKRLLQSRYGLSSDNISVTYAATEDTFQPAENRQAIDQLQQKYKLKPDYVLYAGGTFPARKNYQTLLKAYAQLPKTLRSQHSLVFLTGSRRGSGQERIQKFYDAEQFGPEITEDIVVLDFVEREELITFYQGAGLFVYPSIYEGFGLPPLEAMSCATPVITTNVPAMDEVVAEGGLLVDPMDVLGMAEAMEKVLTDSALRQALGQKGFQRAQNFSWKEAAKGTLEAFEQVMQGNSC